MATAMPNLPQRPKSLGEMATVVVGSLLTGGGIAYATVELIRAEPSRSFDVIGIMLKWGPGYILAGLVAYLVSRLLDKALDGWRGEGELSAAAVREVAVEMRAIAEATARTAAALQTTADKDDRDKQEMQILIGVLNDKVVQVRDEQKLQIKAIELQGEAIKVLIEEQMKQGRALMRIEDRLGIQPPPPVVAEGEKR
jgi:hypothetical protein